MTQPRRWRRILRPARDTALERVLKKSVSAARQSNGRTEQTGFCIVDSQSVKNTDSAGSKGYDPGKKVSGIKRHVAVDSQGLPHAIHVTTAGVTGRAGALAVFGRRREELGRVRNVMADGGYSGKPFAWEVRNLLGASAEVVKRPADNSPHVRATRGGQSFPRP